MRLFFFAIKTTPIIGENRKETKLMDEDKKTLEMTRDELLEELDTLDFGSEEFERASNSIAKLSQAAADERKAKSDEKLKKFDGVAKLVTALAAVLTAVFGGIGVFFKRKTNKEIVKVEETGYVNSKALDNR